MTYGWALLVAGLGLLYAGIKGQTVAEVFKGVISPDKPIFKRGTVGGSGDTTKGTADDTTGTGTIDYAGGALGIVESAAAVAAPFGTTVVSGSRPGSTTSTGNQSDHSARDTHRAANDIGVEGVDAIKGPPPKQLDEAIVAIGNAFGRKYKGGKRIVDTFHYHGYQVQVIWHTPEYGGHLGHIHVGAHELASTRRATRTRTQGQAHKARRIRP